MRQIIQELTAKTQRSQRLRRFSWRPWRPGGKNLPERGASTVEFAASVVLVILMFLGMVQFGAYLWASSVVENAARHGARVGSVTQGCAACQAVSAARAALQGQPLLQNPSVTVLAPGGVVGSTVNIRVSARIPLFLPAGDSLGLDRLTEVQAEATFRQEGW